MPKEIIKLRRSRKTPYESAAHFFAILAYPEAEDRLERERFWQSLCRWAIVTRMAIEPDWGRTYQWIRPAVFSAEDTLHNAILKRGTKRVHQRLAAANYGALPRLEELKFGKKLKAVEGYSPTLNNMAILMGEAMGWKGDDSQATAKTKIWKPTRPVLHA